MKKIGIDVDGVLTDVYNWYLNKGRLYAESHNKHLVNDKGYNAREMYDLTDEEFADFINQYIWDYSNSEPIKDGVREVLTKLANNGYKLIIITARYKAGQDNEEGEKMRECVKRWLASNKVPYDQVIFSNNKTKICEENNIDIMFEDKPSTINSLSKSIPVVCFNAPYNETIKGNNIYRVFEWNEVYNLVDNLIKRR